MIKNICIVCSAKLPQPPVLGGAVSTLIQQWINENEIRRNYHFTCISVFNNDAKLESQNYKYSNFVYVKQKKFSILLDRIITLFLNLIKKTNKIYAWGYLFRTLCFRNGVKKELKKNDFDLIIFENSIPVALCMKSRKLKRKYGNKYIYHTHAVPRKMFRSGEVLQNARLVLCVSDYIKRETLKKFSEYKIQCEVLYNCIDANIFKPQNDKIKDEFRAKLSIQKDDFVVGFIGRISKDKGIVELIEAIKKIDDSNIKLLVAGSTFYNSTTKDKMIQKLASISKTIEDRIIFTGYIKNNETPMFYSATDIMCLPPVWEEPGSITNIEAAACGCPIISTLSGGNIEYIGDNRALLLSKNNREDLINNIAKSILKLKDDNNLRNTLSRNAYSWAKDQTTSEFYERLDKIIKTL